MSVQMITPLRAKCQDRGTNGLLNATKCTFPSNPVYMLQRILSV